MKKEGSSCHPLGEKYVITEEEEELWEHCCHISANEAIRASDTISDEHVDIGMDCDWSVNTFKGERDKDLMDGEEYMAQLKQEFYEELNKHKLDIPK